MYLSLVETTKVEEEDEVYDCSTSWTMVVFVISRMLEISIQDPHPPVSLFASSLDDTSIFFPVSFLDLPKYHDALLPPPTITCKECELKPKVSICKHKYCAY